MPDTPSILLVATHPRAGTHLWINTLCLNYRHVRFGLVRGQYPTLERLVLDHDARYEEEWEAYLAGPPGTVRIVKTHLSRSDLEVLAARLDDLPPGAAALAGRVLEHSRRLYVHRDGRDTLVSWFHYMRDFGGGLPADLRPRLAHLTFSAFLRQPNRYHIPLRAAGPADANRVRYWADHAGAGATDPAACVTSFETLLSDPAAALDRIESALGWPARDPGPVRLPALRRPARTRPGRILQALARRHEACCLRRLGFAAPPSPAWARAGRRGDWRRHFSEDDLAFYAAQAGPVPSALGYSAGGSNPA